MKKFILIMVVILITGCVSTKEPVTVYEAPKKTITTKDEPAKFNLNGKTQTVYEKKNDYTTKPALVYDEGSYVEPAPAQAANSEPDEIIYETGGSADGAGDEVFEPVAEPVAHTQPVVLHAGDVQYPKKTGKPYVIKGITYYPLESVSDDYTEVGVASWYGKDFHGKKTANGEIYDMHAMTAAHKTLPLPTFIRVENLDNGKETVVRVNDRGPFSKGRILDLSYAAGKEIDMIDAGTARVRITVLSQTQNHLRTDNVDVDINKGAFAIQIGAFMMEDNAKRLASEYANSVILKVVEPDRTLYRVQIRGYQSKQAAKEGLELLKTRFFDAFIIAE